MSPLYKLLQNIGDKAKYDTELGTAFEQLSEVFLGNNAIQKQQYSQVWQYKDWAKDNPEFSSVDTGIDLVAKLTDEGGFCAIQCKFYKSDHTISKSDLDSFISASSTADFSCPSKVLLTETYCINFI